MPCFSFEGDEVFFIVGEGNVFGLFEDETEQDAGDGHAEVVGYFFELKHGFVVDPYFKLSLTIVSFVGHECSLAGVYPPRQEKI